MVSTTRQRINGNVSDRRWIGTHTFVIRGTNGAEDNSADARGNGGFFASIDSNPLQMTIRDPCVDSVVNSNAMFELETPFLVPAG